MGREIVTRQQQQHNTEEEKEERAPLPDLNFAGCAIGNGLVQPSIQYRWYLPYAEEKGLVGTFVRV